MLLDVKLGKVKQSTNCMTWVNRKRMYILGWVRYINRRLIGAQDLTLKMVKAALNS